MGERRPDATLGELLASRRRRRFVGRAAQVELFRAAVESAEPPFSVLYVYGPAGIGKTSLLDRFAEQATLSGARLIRLDGRDLDTRPEALLEVLREVMEPTSDRSGDEQTGMRRVVLLLDTYERLSSLDQWIRTGLLPALPATAIVGIAGRDRPSPAWRSDSGWRDLSRVVSLRNLLPQESLEYLRLSNVDPALHDQILRVTHGHPLGLSLLADVIARGGEATVDPLTPDVVGVLLRRFVDAVPSLSHRRALEVCALTRVTSEALLRDALEVQDAGELFGWLRDLSFVESGAEGLFPHELARDVLDADLRWRDLEGYKRVFRGVRARIHGRLRCARGVEQQRAVLDEKFLFRNLPSVLSPVDWQSWGRHHAQPARREDRQAIVDMVRAAEGDESAAIAAHWFDRQPEAFFVLRQQDGHTTGLLGLLELTKATAADLSADPGARAAWDFAAAHGPPQPGDVVMQSRFIIDKTSYQAPSPTLNLVPVLTMQRYLDTPRLSWDFLTLAEPDRWNDYFAVADLPRAAGADFVIGDRGYGLFAHDFRRVPVDAWLELVTERALTQDFALAPPQAPQVLVQSQPEFGEAVRQALRDLHRPDLLARNPLLLSRLLRDRAGGDAPDARLLARVVREAADTLRAHPRDDKLWRAVERTFLRPAATQERAAAALGLPFSTYRRHLTQGLARIVSWLWEQEVYSDGEHR